MAFAKPCATPLERHLKFFVVINFVSVDFKCVARLRASGALRTLTTRDFEIGEGGCATQTTDNLARYAYPLAFAFSCFASFSISAVFLYMRTENTPVLGVDDVVRVFDTCPACQDPQALRTLAAPHVTNRLTTLERTVINGA